MGAETFQDRQARIFTGKQVGLPESDKALVAALDESVIVGATGLLRFPKPLHRGIRGVASAVLAYPGRFDNFRDEWPDDLGKITNASVSVAGPHHLDKVPLMPPNMVIDSALRVGADAVSFQIHTTSSYEHGQLQNAAQIGEACRKNDMPFLVHAYPRKMKRRWKSPWKNTEYHYRDLPGEHTPIEVYTDHILNGASRAIDLGATAVKLPRPGTTESAKAVVDFVHAHKVKVLFAGGPTTDVRTYLEKVRRDMDAGADGEATGRNYFGRKLGPPEELELNANRLFVATARIVYHDDSVDAAIRYSGVDLRS